RVRGKIVDTTVGRVLLGDIVPQEVPFEFINKDMTKKVISSLLDASFRLAGAKKTVIFADRLMNLGFDYATKSGLSMGIKDMIEPVEKEELLSAANREVGEIENQY